MQLCYVYNNLNDFWFNAIVVAASLQITDAEEEDQGNYECMAENTHGSALSEMATLFVRGMYRIHYLNHKFVMHCSIN